MKSNRLVPVENFESATLRGRLYSACKMLLEDPHTTFFVETMPLCVQLNLIVLLRLTVVNAFYIEPWEVAAILSDLVVTALIYSIGVTAKLRFLLSTKLQKIGAVTVLGGGFIAHIAQVLFAPNIQTSIVNEFLATALPMLLHYLAIGTFSAFLQLLWEKPDSVLHRWVDKKACKK